MEEIVQSKKSTYCSRLIVEAYGAAGLFSNEYIIEACMSPNDLITGSGFAYVGYISEKEKPRFHDLDVNAPVIRDKVQSW